MIFNNICYFLIFARNKSILSPFSLTNGFALCHLFLVVVSFLNFDHNNLVRISFLFLCYTINCRFLTAYMLLVELFWFFSQDVSVQDCCHNLALEYFCHKSYYNRPFKNGLFIWGFMSLSTMYRSYHDGYLEGQRKPIHTVGQGSVL